MPSAIVIGAGPAGSVAGVMLARAGWQVTLIEQHTFPRDKVCGECLSALGAAVLERLQLREGVLAGAICLKRTILHSGDGQQAEIALPAPCWGLSRRRMDTALLSAARLAGCCVIQPARVERCMSLSGAPGYAGRVGAQVTLRDLRSNKIETLEADYALLADGKSALIGLRPALTGDLGVKAHLTSVDGPRDAVELFSLDGHYVGLNPVDGEVWNLAMSVPAHRVKTLNRDFDALLAEMLRLNTSLARRLKRSRRVSEWLTSPLPRFAVNAARWPPGIIPLGNAAAALEPVGGEGMGLAMASSELGATALIAADRRDERLHFGSIAPSYQRLWRLRRPACRAAALLLSHHPDAAVDWLAANPLLGRGVLWMLGKG